MSNFSLPKAIYIATGNELVSGQIKEINVVPLANLLIKDNIELCEVRILPDDIEIISNAIKKTKTKYDFVFVSGGIGIAKNDLTAVSIANAFGVKLVLNNILLKKLKKKYPLEFKKNNNPQEMSMAYVPYGAEIIENNNTDVPGFIIDNVYALPGDPNVFEYMIKQVSQIIKNKVFTFSHSAIFEINENKIKDIVLYVDNKYKAVNISIHSFISSKNVGSEVILTSKNKNELEKAVQYLHNMIRARMSNTGNNTETNNSI